MNHWKSVYLNIFVTLILLPLLWTRLFVNSGSQRFSTICMRLSQVVYLSSCNWILVGKKNRSQNLMQSCYDLEATLYAVCHTFSDCLIIKVLNGFLWSYILSVLNKHTYTVCCINFWLVWKWPWVMTFIMALVLKTNKLKTVLDISITQLLVLFRWAL